MKKVKLAIAAGITLWVSAGSASSQTIGIVAGSTRPRIQLTGEHFQIQSNGLYFYDFVPGRSLSQVGAIGADLGTPVVYQDKILFLFGDTLAAYSTPGPKYYLASGSGADDSIGFIPNVDLSQCNYIGSVDQQLMQGNPQPSVSAGRLSRNAVLPESERRSAGPQVHDHFNLRTDG